MGTCASLTDLCFAYDSSHPSDSLDSYANKGASGNLNQAGELHHINLTIADGDFIALAGLTGSGKTTLLRHLTGTHIPSGKRSGTIQLFGLSPHQLQERHDDSLISYVPQRPREMLCAATLRQELNIRLGTSARGQLAATDILGFLGLAQFIDQPIDDLSEGQAQRASLAAALAKRPRLLLLDEPTANLDSVTRRMTLDLLERVNRDIGITIVMADHHLDGLLTIANRIVALDHGSVIADADPQTAMRLLWNKGSQEARALLPDVQHYFLAQPTSQSDASPKRYPLPLTVSQGRTLLQERCNVPSPRQTTPQLSQPRKPHGQAQTKTNAAPLALHVNDISYAHDDDTDFAIADLSFTARYGELIMLLGQSGSGKSTLLDLLAGIKRAQFGSIRWQVPGKFGTLRSQSAARSAGSIAFMPQDVRPLLNLFAGAHLTETHLDSEAPINGEALPDPLDQSLGQQQLEAFTTLKAQGKRLYLLDEPTQGLDQIATAEVGAGMRQLACNGCLVIAATHDVDFCARYADRAIVLAASQIVADGSPRSIIADEMFSTTPMRRLFRGIRPGILTLADALPLADTPSPSVDALPPTDADK